MQSHRTAPSAFAERRNRLRALFPHPAAFASGFARPRNFPGNRYPFRAESHFLYLVGIHLEGAVLAFDGAAFTLYVDPPHPDEQLWVGELPTAESLSRDLGIEVRPVDDFSMSRDTAVLPPQDGDTAAWLGALLDRDLDAGGGDELSGKDGELADAMIRLRLVHDEAALAQLRLAARLTEYAHAAGRTATRPGVREHVVRAAMEGAVLAHGACLAYGPIVTVHGEVLHNERHDNVLADGDLLLADVGAETNEGWAGDVTRTWPVSGRFSGSQREIYELVLAAQLAAIAEMRPKVRYLDVHRAAGRQITRGLVELGIFRGDPEELFHDGAAALFFPHGVGHLIGLDVHDLEDLGDRAGYAPGRRRPESAGDRYLRLDRDLEPNMVVTVEPGFYQIGALLSDPAAVGPLEKALDRGRLARFADVRGIRIEDDVRVTAAAPEVLTANIPKTVEDIQRET